MGIFFFKRVAHARKSTLYGGKWRRGGMKELMAVICVQITGEMYDKMGLAILVYLSVVYKGL